MTLLSFAGADSGFDFITFQLSSCTREPSMQNPQITTHMFTTKICLFPPVYLSIYRAFVSQPTTIATAIAPVLQYFQAALVVNMPAGQHDQRAQRLVLSPRGSAAATLVCAIVSG